MRALGDVLKPARSGLIGVFIIFVLLLFSLAVSGEQPAAAEGHMLVELLDKQSISSVSSASSVSPGNYCIGCHMPGDPLLAEATTWRGTKDSWQNVRCPAVKVIQEELYLTERLMLAVDNSRQRLPANAQTVQIDTRISTVYPGYSRLLDKPVSSLDAFVSEAQVLRYQLGKIYTAINQQHQARQLQWVLLAALLTSLIVLFSLGWGYWNSRSFLSDTGSKRVFPWTAISLLVVIFLFFALPIFHDFSPEAAATESEQAVQAALDTAGRSGKTAGRAQARAWVLAKVAAESNIEETQAQRLVEALNAEKDSRASSTALWGQAQSAHEAAGIFSVSLDDASRVTQQLAVFENRAWSLRMIAVEWTAVDPILAEEILKQAHQLALQETPLYRDLDLAGIANAWLAFDRYQAFSVARDISDPEFKNWALRTLAGAPGSGIGFELSVEAAREIVNPVARAAALVEIARLAGDPSFANEAHILLEGRHGPDVDYVLSRLAGVSGVESDILESIQGASARAYALLASQSYQAAWEAAANIADRYDRAHAQAEVAAAWKNVESARKIEVPLFRDRALRQIGVDTQDIELAKSIESSSEKVLALAYLNQFDAAWDAARQNRLVDGYPLVVLGVRSAKVNPITALEIVDILQNEADKAEVMREVAAGTGDPAHFERALALALAARVRGDALSPVEASLSLASQVGSDLFAKTALEQAYEIAQRISIK